MLNKVRRHEDVLGDRAGTRSRLDAKTRRKKSRSSTPLPGHTTELSRFSSSRPDQYRRPAVWSSLEVRKESQVPIG